MHIGRDCSGSVRDTVRGQLPDKNPLGRTPSILLPRARTLLDLFSRKLALTRTPDPIRPTKRVPTPTDQRTAAKNGVMIYGDFVPGGGGLVIHGDEAKSGMSSVRCMANCPPVDIHTLTDLACSLLSD